MPSQLLPASTNCSYALVPWFQPVPDSPLSASTPACPLGLSSDSYRHSQHPLLHHGLLLSQIYYLLLSWIINSHFTEDRSNHLLPSAESSHAWKSPPLSITLFNKPLPFIPSGLHWSLYPDGLGSSRDRKRMALLPRIPHKRTKFESRLTRYCPMTFHFSTSLSVTAGWSQAK